MKEECTGHPKESQTIEPAFKPPTMEEQRKALAESIQQRAKLTKDERRLMYAILINDEIDIRGSGRPTMKNRDTSLAIKYLHEWEKAGNPLGEKRNEIIESIAPKYGVTSETNVLHTTKEAIRRGFKEIDWWAKLIEGAIGDGIPGSRGPFRRSEIEHMELLDKHKKIFKQGW